MEENGLPAGNSQKESTNMQQQQQQQCRPGSASSNNKDHFQQHKDREERIKQLKEKQNEERQRKLEELKAQALATQKLREQKEEERKRRMDELKSRDNEKRLQVEERKKAIWEAEKERREYILRKNQERDTRLETKRKNERSQIAFAFGSSTPRMLDNELGSAWAYRRANSISNVACNTSISPLTRRSSERELGDGSAKKRATSASGLDRQSEDDSCGTVYYSVHRRRTDLMPTIPSPRDTCRSSIGTHTPRTPGRAFSMTRLDQLAKPHRKNGEHIFAVLERERKHAEDLENMSKMSLSQGSSPSNQDKRKSRSMSQLNGRVKTSRDSSRNNSQNRFVSPLHRKNAETTKSMTQLPGGRFIEKKSSPATKSGLRSGEITPKSISLSRPSSAMSTSTTNSSVNRRTTPKRTTPRPISIAETGVNDKFLSTLTSSTIASTSPSATTPTTKSSSATKLRSTSAKTPTTNDITPKHATSRSAKATPKASTTPSQQLMSPSTEVPPPIKQSEKKQIVVCDEKTIINDVIEAEQKHTEASFCENNVVNGDNTDAQEQSQQEIKSVMQEAVEIVNEVVDAVEHQQNDVSIQEVEMKNESAALPPTVQLAQDTISVLENADMTASMIAKSKITTEEEAKAAIAERRRIAREEAQRQAELERKRLEAEEEAERQRQAEEEERQRQLEAEATRLAEEQRKAEEERLQQAIEENLKREEEEKKKREEEARLKKEREKAEEKAREDAERAKLENAERLKKEEAERLERKKRVNEILARTRKGASGTPSKNDESVDLSKSQVDLMSQSVTDTSPSSEQSNVVIPQNQSQQSTNDNNDYERSVTEKENLLMSGFNKLNLNGNGLNNNLLETNNNLNLLNGKESASSDLILGVDGNNGVVATNGHDKGSIENTFANQTSDLSTTKPNEDKLIDFGSDINVAITSNDQMSETTTTTNLNNNNFLDSSLITHNNLNNNNLVAASDTNVERDLSLL